MDSLVEWFHQDGIMRWLLNQEEVNLDRNLEYATYRA